MNSDLHRPQCSHSNVMLRNRYDSVRMRLMRSYKVSHCGKKKSVKENETVEKG